jgi:heptosyltransferase-2
LISPPAIIFDTPFSAASATSVSGSAFIGDVVLSTALIESLHAKYPTATIDIVVRKGNEALFAQHPYISNVIIWDKQQGKYANWLKVLKQLRAQQYDVLINVQRYAATGLWTAFSKAMVTIGFDKNPFSFLFTHKVKHEAIQTGLHEIQKNHALIQFLDEDIPLCNPKLYPAPSDLEKVKSFLSPLELSWLFPLGIILSNSHYAL